MRAAVCAFSFGCLSLASACATHPDIVGDNDEAQEWAEAQKREPKDKTKDWPGRRPAGNAPQAQPPAPEGQAR